MTSPEFSTSEANLDLPSVTRLASLFYSSLAEIGHFEPVVCDDLSEAARGLLAHHDHMTVALETYYHSPVLLQALAEWRDETSYARASILRRQSDNAIVQFGVMRVGLADLPDTVQQEITSKKSPLGRVLIEHNLLRKVELIALWKIKPGPVLCEHFDCNPTQTTYGRTAQILVEHRPTVQLLEIVR
ncbi:MAG: hypothetical protein IT425_05280 [Pirellulales bacterium]|nr:hypothetical protein [Pirellulales bacterium]